MNNLRRPIAPLIANLFPDKFRENGPRLVAFVETYYKWHDEMVTRSIVEDRSINTAPDAFVELLRQTYTDKFKLESQYDQKTLIKHSLDIYRSKGTAEAIDLLIRLLFQTESEVTYPADKIFRASANIWIEPIYIELSHNFSDAIKVEGSIIEGQTTGAEAFIESVERRRSMLSTSTVAFISNATGAFAIGEQMVGTNIQIKGSLDKVTLVNRGAGIPKYSELSIRSVTGQEGIGRVIAVSSTGAITKFAVINSGVGFVSGQTVTMYFNGIAVATGTAINGPIGRLPGRYLTNVGMLSGDNFLHDGEYYQQYSYVVSSAISFDKYSDVLQKILHVAGTKSFSAVVVTGDTLSIRTFDNLSEVSTAVEEVNVGSGFTFEFFRPENSGWLGVI